MEAFKLSHWNRAVEERRAENIDIEYWSEIRSNLASLPYPKADKGITLDIGDTIEIGRLGDLDQSDTETVRSLVKSLFPWRKGPFSLFGIEIDAEWRSNLKWDRFKSVLPDLKGKSVLDIGCNNGYYLFRLASQHPELAVGIDPNARYYFQFTLLNRYAGFKNMYMEPVGIEEVPFLEKKFDLVLYLGVIYHRRDPLESLRIIRNAMSNEGVLIVESLTVPGDSSYVLRPAERYSKMRNVWNIPSELCLIEWLKVCGFKRIEVVSTHKTNSLEQRRTELAPFESLEDFLDPANSNLTVEGYPAPIRSIIRCEC